MMYDGKYILCYNGLVAQQTLCSRWENHSLDVNSSASVPVTGTSMDNGGISLNQIRL